MPRAVEGGGFAVGKGALLTLRIAHFRAGAALRSAPVSGAVVAPTCPTRREGATSGKRGAEAQRRRGAEAQRRRGAEAQRRRGADRRGAETKHFACVPVFTGQFGNALAAARR